MTEFNLSPGAKTNWFRSGLSIGKSLAVMTCVASLALLGCSKSKSAAADGIVDQPDGKGDTKKPDVATVSTAIDSLVKKNKGKGVITGFLTGEGKSIASGLLKQASNAAGERRLLTHEEKPLDAATVLIFNALKPTTQADTTVKTDSAGNYTVVLPEGKYFGFAVYLNLETFQLVTTQIPNINPIADVAVKMDTAIAAEDVTSPTVTSVYDATSPNSDNIFLVGSIPSTDAKVNVTFSEPMNRESIKGVVLGKIDTSNTSSTLVLADTVKGITVTWSGDSKEMTLNVKALDEGVQYGVIIPVSMKDLAKNPLEKQYGATFQTVAAAELAAVKFAMGSTFPADGDTTKPNQNPAVTFNRPVDVFSVMKNATIKPALTGFWEVAGARAVFQHKEPLKVGETYTLTMPTTVKDLAGNGLEKDVVFKFTVKDFEGAAKEKTGRDKEVALAVENMFNAYVQGDLGRFGAAFHPNFRMISGSEIKSKTEFLENIRSDVSEKQLLAAGILAPVYDVSDDACKDHNPKWKVLPDDGKGDFIWAQAYVSAGQVPQFWDKDGKVIAKADLQFEQGGPRLTYSGRKYIYAPDFSNFKGPVNQDGAKNDMRFMADVMKKTSTLDLQIVKADMKESFTVDGSMELKGDTAKVAVKMISTEKYSRDNWDYNRNCDSVSETNYQILKFLLVYDGSKWLVLNVISPEHGTNKEDFNKGVDFKDVGASSTKPITLVAPVNNKENAADKDGNVEFKWKGVDADSVGGYLFGISEDPRFCGNRPPYGAFIFVKAGKKGDTVSFKLDANAKVVGSNASPILRRVQDFRLPGWERTVFEFVMSQLQNSTDKTKLQAGVFNWKTIAIKDTSAAQFLANGFKVDRYLGESDYGPVRGYFAVKNFPQGAAFAQFENQQNAPGNGQGQPNNFNDADNDGIPDFMETKYKSDPRDRNSYPDFTVDTDGDKLSDYIEKLLDPKGEKGLVDSAATKDELKSEIDALKAAGIDWVDSDSDGFPDDIEQMLGFNANDKMSNPGTRPRASAPVGVFKGKLNTSGTMSDLSFRIYKDSTGKLLNVAYTANIGQDTLIDTVRASFSELKNELGFQIILSATGPDAGRSLWLRGGYDQNQQLLMGPVDIGPSQPKTSDMINGGPQAGQWAASGRGDDVTGRLGGGNGGNGGANGVPNTTQPVAQAVEYRTPPAGVSEGSVLTFTKDGGLLMINEVKDTVVLADKVMFRSSPSGVDFNGMVDVKFVGGEKRTEFGGQLVPTGDGWAINGHVFVQFDSVTVHKQIPGQIVFKADKAAITMVNGDQVTVVGELKGWIQQDKLGTGLQGNSPPANGGPTNTCQPSPDKPCDPNMNGGNTPAPQQSFGRPFVQGVTAFKDKLKGMGIQEGQTFYIGAGARVLSVVNDSNGVFAAKAPWCGQVRISGTLVTPKTYANDAEKKKYEDDANFLAGENNLMIVLEDQMVGGKLAIIDKVLDASGEIRTNVIGTEMRPKPADYGVNACGTNPGPVTNNPPPVGNTPPPPKPAIPGFTGNLDEVKTLVTAANGAVVWFNDNKQPQNVEVDVNSVSRDSATKFVTAMTKAQPAQRVIFLSDSTKALAKLDTKAVIANPAFTAGQTTTPPPTQNPPTQNPPAQNPPPANQGPVVFKGQPSALTTLLAASGNKVAVMGLSGTPVIAEIVGTASVDGDFVVLSDKLDDTLVYVVMGLAQDPTKPLVVNNVIQVVSKAVLLAAK